MTKEKRYEAHIGYNHDFVRDNRTGVVHDIFSCEELLNNYNEENRKLSRALMRLSEKNVQLKKELDHQEKYVEHESYGVC